MTKADKGADSNQSEERETAADTAQPADTPEMQAEGGQSDQDNDRRSDGDDKVFQPLDKQESSEKSSRDLEMVMDIPVKLNVQLGRTRVTIKQLLELTEGSVVELDGLAGDPMDIFINDYLVAQGEVVVVDDKYGIRITEIISPSERIHKLNR